MKTILTAATLSLALAISTGAARADETCNVPPADMQPWESLVQMAHEFEWTISEMQIDDGCYELRVIDQAGNVLKVTVDPVTLDVIDGEVKRWGDAGEEHDRRGKRQRAPAAAPAAPADNPLFQNGTPPVVRAN